ncbi:MAG: DUF1735 domain-containing protein [Ferruginibacter sp.]
MKEIKIKGIFSVLIATLCLSSCLKKDVMNIDTEETTSTIMELQFIENGSGSTINSGMQYFSGGALTYPGSHTEDTASYNISLAGPVTLGSDLSVTVGVDATRILDNFSSDSISYELMPDSLYHFVSTTAVIKAGERIAPMKLVFYPSKIDITKSYMLPVIIKDAGGKTVSGNFGIIYFHVIGNPLAGPYVMTGTRYNYNNGPVSWSGPAEIPSPNSGTTPYSGVITASPVNAKTIQLVMGNIPDPVSGSAVYLITGDATFSNITYDFAKTFTDGYSNIIKYVVSYTPPSATQKASFHLMTKYNNTTGNAGNDRLVDQTFTHQ